MEFPRILIADDQTHVLEALQLLLKNEGFISEAVTSPGAVVQAVQDRNFDVLLLDMNYARDTTSGGEGLEL
jgi:CheY-like chemotaxis protein